MAAVLVTLEDLQAYLGIDTDAELLQALLDEVEALLVAACDRQDRPFAAAAEAARTEIHDGTGTATLWLDYPASAADTVTSLVIGRDAEDPDETVDVSDIFVRAGSRQLRRTDGGRFGCVDDPGVVHVTYTAAADLPADAALAVKRVVAAIYWQRGSEGTSTERVGGYSAELSAVAASDPVWRAAVDRHREVTV